MGVMVAVRLTFDEAEWVRGAHGNGTFGRMTLDEAFCLYAQTVRRAPSVTYPPHWLATYNRLRPATTA